MNRILFFILLGIPLLASQVWAGVEIFVNGHKYDSFQDYQASKKLSPPPSSAKAVSLNSQQEEYIRMEAKRMGIKVDFSKVKTFEMNHKGSSDKALHKFYVMSVENGVVKALNSFYHSWGELNTQNLPKISSEQLQDIIQQSVTRSKEPKLLISQPGKIRIMALSAQTPSK